MHDFGHAKSRRREVERMAAVPILRSNSIKARTVSARDVASERQQNVSLVDV